MRISSVKFVERGRRGRSDRSSGSLQPSHLGYFYTQEREAGKGKVSLTDLFLALIFAQSLLKITVFASEAIAKKTKPVSIAPQHVQAGMGDLSAPLDGLF